MTPLAQALAQSQRGRRSTRALRSMPDAAPDARNTPDLAEAMHDAVALFRELKIGYALIGGLAAMVHGRSRYTEDVDFVAEPDHADIFEAHPDAMRRHGFDPTCAWKLYHRSEIAIDLWKDRHAAGIVERAVRRKLGKRFVKVAEPHDLIAMKLRADRPQDDYDIAEIVKAQRIEESVLAERVTAAQLRKFRKIAKRVES
ncbi:MAG: nucleotidyltransferase [Planctomycetota bacterium]